MNKASEPIEGDRSCVDAVLRDAAGDGHDIFNSNDGDWQAFLSGLDQLTLEEALSEQECFVAVFRAGTVSADRYLEGMKAFAAHPESEIVVGSTRLLGFIHDEFPDLRTGLAAYVRETYRDRYRRMRGEDSVAADRLAPALGNLLATIGDDADAKNYLLRQGTLYLGLGVLEQDEAKRAGVPNNILGPSFRELMTRLPQPAFDPLVELAVNGTRAEKIAALYALSATPDVEQARRLMDMAQAEDSPFTDDQSEIILTGLMKNTTHRAMVWTGYKQNFSSYISRQGPDNRSDRAPLIAMSFCSLDARDDVRDFFSGAAELIPGYETHLAQTIEAIERCSALKMVQGPSLKAALGENQ